MSPSFEMLLKNTFLDDDAAHYLKQCESIVPATVEANAAVDDKFRSEGGQHFLPLSNVWAKAAWGKKFQPKIENEVCGVEFEAPIDAGVDCRFQKETFHVEGLLRLVEPIDTDEPAE